MLGLDDQAHAHRRAMFRSLLTDDAARDLAARTRAGLPDSAVPPRAARNLAAIVDGFGSVGVRGVRARRARRYSERWVRRLVRGVRDGRIAPVPGSALAVITEYRDQDGALLPDPTAAGELLNVLRPTVAVAYLISYAGLMLHRHPDWRARLAAGDDRTLEAFALEVRRCCPFVPALAARTRDAFTWRGHQLDADRLVVLDVYGTDHDPEQYPSPERFDPTRFLGREPDAFSYLPQGGGPVDGHRCPGERIAIEAVKAAVQELCRITFTVPVQNLRLRLSRLPARPTSGFVILPLPDDPE